MKRIPNAAIFGALLLGLMIVSLPTTANDSILRRDYLSLGIGYYDILDDDEAADFRVEYRSDWPILWNIKPWFGGEITSDASVWAGGGLLADFKLTPDFYLTPSVGVGFYNDGESGKDLDHPVQFRTQIEIGYEFGSGDRIGVAFSHMSNAGLGDDNPGTEIFGLYYHIPLDRLF